MMKLLQIYFLANLIFVCTANSGTLLSARCRSRCFSHQEIQRQNVTLARHVPCTSHTCLACLKPCEERKKKSLLSCSWLCGLHYTTVKIKRICQDSCKFLKHTHLEDGNSTSCPDGVSYSECVLTRPENVQVHVPERNKKSQNYTIRWNATATSSTVFVVMAKQQQKGSSPSDADIANNWREIKQTTLQSVKVDLQPLFWYQFKVAAVNQYGASSFSVPSRFIFANPRRPGLPREFKVTAMHAIKDHVQVNLAWKKPINSIGLPIHRYRLSWSMRPDSLLDKFVSFEVTDKRLKGNVHEYTIRELLSNKTYVLELQAISRWREQRLRSRRVTLRIRTPVLEDSKEEIVKKKPPPLTKVVPNGNSLVKKTVSKESTVSVEPTTWTVKETNPTKRSSTRPSTASTLSNGGVSPENVQEQKSIAGANRVSWFMLIALVALAATVICYLR